MKKFLVLFAIIMLLTIPVLAESQNGIDLGSNLSFTFEPAAAKPLIITPLPDLSLNIVQEKTDKNYTTPIIVLLSVCLFAASVTAMATD